VDHAAPYAHHGEIYSKLGYDFYAMDVRGHGKSEGTRLYCPNVDRNAQDIKSWMELTLKKFYSEEAGF
jgi:alpha-beta hydrolase superfamily lysophospholipase